VTTLEILEDFAEAVRPRRPPWIDGARVVVRRGARAYHPRRGRDLTRLEQLEADQAALRNLERRRELARFVSFSAHFPCQRCKPWGVVGLCGVARILWLERGRR
jgi:hypothetical protein